MTPISALWWAYFDMVSIVGEQRFRGAPPDALNRSRLVAAAPSAWR